MNEELFSKEQHTELMSKIGKLQNDHIRNGIDHKTSREMASNEVAKELNITGKQLESKLAKTRCKFYDVRRVAAQKKNGRPKYKVIDKYRFWCEHHSHIMSDAEIAYWFGCSKSGPNNARISLKTEGFAFESTEYGFNIIAKPERKKDKKVYSENDIIKIVADVISKLK